ncbi:phosphogluconate 2-dehydrogenase/D-3-phosphoglycerate dehydrogenase/gluconate 2-dehydrogenase [Brevibacterium sanguinis]|uniref:Phosphogluconate 2-dehydrogenase/D-3-phosphoglycerate dehydrogenase/gluconate 2-dehydrogenase n=2 Tax=Brevibacterium TaxID=1696 RepID=A0A366IJ38_9MICO|nr:MULTISPECIES: NAD(P)-dependent oxidoreductase [Brevibacterium]RBP65067.1 phosphogluconate 2-dehydrogenase/D-3-phosphoglycerate dehydrogenase/gluconate 2-dehydrogenase [Brevibacterium sanguinis]RBP71330.1 phosphogluconate 2-dehydrogenase/D-3-phosphoglycerate dehydrogenase/gluconate 2-dehydrogenase [Brevibacterium celere]
MTHRVVYVNPLKDYIDPLLAAAPEDFTVTIVPPEADRAEQCRAAADADFLISGVEVHEDVFRSARNARFIQYMSSGYGQLPLSVLDDLGIPVAQMKTHSISVAEHAITLMLTLLRRIPHSMQLMREGKWRQDLAEESYAELYGKTVGIVGLGNIGRWVAKIAHYGFGANVVFYDRAEIPLTVSELVSAEPVSLPELMTVSDIVCVCLPLNEGSDKLIGRDELALMSPRSILVNISRGEVVDESALIECLREGRIAGAGLDVYESEPLDPDSELFTLERAICTPHMAGVGWENVERRIETVWGNFATVLRGGIPRGVVTAAKRAAIPAGAVG